MAIAIERLQSASGGLNTDAAPDYVGKEQAPVHQNLLTRDGKLVARGGITNGYTLGSTQDAISGIIGPDIASAQVGLDQFTGTAAAGTLNTRVAPLGGTWATSGAGADFTFVDPNDFSASHPPSESIKRIATDGTERFAILGATDYTDTQASIAGEQGTATGLIRKLILRWTDASNYAAAVIDIDAANVMVFKVITVIASVTTVLSSVTPAGFPNAFVPIALTFNVTASGLWSATWSNGANPVASLTGTAASLATGGALATGKPGLSDSKSVASATPQRYYDEFVVYASAPPIIVGFWADTFSTVFPLATKTAAKRLTGGDITLSSALLAPTTRAGTLTDVSYAFGGQSGSVVRNLLQMTGTSSEPVRYDNAGTATAPTLSGIYGDVTAHLDRLFVLGAALSTAGGRDYIMWSDVGTAGATADLTHAAWKDDVSGLYNQIKLPETPVAFAHVGRYLAIFAERSVWTLFGDTPASFSLRRIADNIRVFPDARCTADVDDGCYFLCDRGLMYYDGSQLRQVSGGVRVELASAVADARADWTTDRSGFAATSYLQGGCLLVTIGKQNRGLPPTIYFSGLYDIQRNTWTRFATEVSTGSSPTHVTSWIGTQYGLDGRSAYVLNGVAQPETQPFTEDDDPLSSNGLRVVLKWYTRLARLAAPGLTAKIRRVFVDYRFDSGLASGWSVSAVDGLGNTVLAAQQVTDTPAGQARKRSIFDVHGEASDLQVRLEWSGTWTAADDVVAAELHDVNIELNPAQQRASGF